jgi:peptide/nickel transport system substrate-binding protein
VEPETKDPATQWEAEIDRLMRAQASAVDNRTRKRYFDEVQAIVAEQAPFIYLVNKNALVGMSPLLQGVDPVAMRPQTYWNIERIKFAVEKAGNEN